MGREENPEDPTVKFAWGRNPKARAREICWTQPRERKQGS